MASVRRVVTGVVARGQVPVILAAWRPRKRRSSALMSCLNSAYTTGFNAELAMENNLNRQGTSRGKLWERKKLLTTIYTWQPWQRRKMNTNTHSATAERTSLVSPVVLANRVCEPRRVEPNLRTQYGDLARLAPRDAQDVKGRDKQDEARYQVKGHQ